MFKITEDCTENKKLNEYYSSDAPKGTPEFEELIKKFESGPQYIFHMCDEDGEVLYIGYSDDNTKKSGFDPFDMYGEYYGCFDIQYLNEKGEFQRL